MNHPHTLNCQTFHNPYNFLAKLDASTEGNKQANVLVIILYVFGFYWFVLVIFMSSLMHHPLIHRFTSCKASETYQLACIHCTVGKYLLLQPVATVRSWRMLCAETHCLNSTSEFNSSFAIQRPSSEMVETARLPDAVV